MRVTITKFSSDCTASFPICFLFKLCYLFPSYSFCLYSSQYALISFLSLINVIFLSLKTVMKTAALIFLYQKTNFFILNSSDTYITFPIFTIIVIVVVVVIIIISFSSSIVFVISDTNYQHFLLS